ncbi:BON domain-containing protein [Dyadobacter pollutisoli]
MLCGPVERSSNMKTWISDALLMKHIVSTLHQNSRLHDEDIRVSVKEGWVSLEGKVDQESDRQLVQESVERVLGVYGITNNLTFSWLHSN